MSGVVRAKGEKFVLRQRPVFLNKYPYYGFFFHGAYYALRYIRLQEETLYRV
jgi:hypothetical protein